MTAREVRKLQEEREKERGSGTKDMWLPTLKSSSDYYLVRLGPPWKEGGEFWKDRFIHGGIKKHGRIIKVYCAKNDIDKETGDTRSCKVCRRLRKLRKGERSDYSKELFKLIVQRREGLWNAVMAEARERSNGKFEISGLKKPGKWQIWQLSQKWTDELTDIFADEDYREESVLGVTDLKTGRWIRVRRTGEGRDTEYKFKVLSDKYAPEKIGDSELRHKLQGSLINLDKIVKGSTDEELESFLEEMEKMARKKASSKSSDDKKSSDEKHKKSSSGDHHHKKSSSDDKKKSSSDDKKKSSSHHHHHHSSDDKKKSSSGDKHKKSSSDDKKKKSSSDDKKKSASSDNKDAKEVLKEMKKSMEKKSKHKGSSSGDKKKSSSEDKKKSSDDKKKSKSKSKSRSKSS